MDFPPLFSPLSPYSMEERELFRYLRRDDFYLIRGENGWWAKIMAIASSALKIFVTLLFTEYATVGFILGYAFSDFTDDCFENMQLLQEESHLLVKITIIGFILFSPLLRRFFIQGAVGLSAAYWGSSYYHDLETLQELHDDRGTSAPAVF